MRRDFGEKRGFHPFESKKAEKENRQKNCVAQNRVSDKLPDNSFHSPESALRYNTALPEKPERLELHPFVIQQSPLFRTSCALLLHRDC